MREAQHPLPRDRQVAVVGEQPVPPAPGDLPGDAEDCQRLQGFAGGGEAQAAEILRLEDAGELEVARGLARMEPLSW